MKTLYFAGGCFWGVQHFFDQFPGVVKTEAGYANGPDAETDYKKVCASSGHAETVRVDFDEAVISPEKLIDFYFLAVDPLSVNRQGHDTGIQYRTGIYSNDEELRETARRKLAELTGKLGQTPAVECGPLKNFCPAEEYHQKYLEKNPSGYCHLPAALFRLAATQKES